LTTGDPAAVFSWSYGFTEPSGGQATSVLISYVKYQDARGIVVTLL
jgi:hypothetical protein